MVAAAVVACVLPPALVVAVLVVAALVVAALVAAALVVAAVVAGAAVPPLLEHAASPVMTTADRSRQNKRLLVFVPIPPF